MSENNSDYEKKIAKANASRQRQIERQKAKLACPQYQMERQARQQASQTRSYERLKERNSDPDYIKEQREKQIRAAEKQQQRLRIKEADPEYVKNRNEKILSQAKALQVKNLEKNAKNRSPVKSDIQHSKSPKSKGLKGRSPTSLEKYLGNRIGDIGCICCLNKGWYTSDMQEQETTKFVSLHHVDGRTKEWAHAKVLPLCAYHHDTPAPTEAPVDLTPIHRGNKNEWIKLNGTEEELLKQIYEMIEEDRPWLNTN